MGYDGVIVINTHIDALMFSFSSSSNTFPQITCCSCARITGLLRLGVFFSFSFEIDLGEELQKDEDGTHTGKKLFINFPL